VASNRELKAFRLETFSHWCANRFLELHPGWLPYVQGIKREEDGLAVRTLVIEFPSQNPAIADPLTVSVDLDRIITVSWFPVYGGMHWHTDSVYYLRGLNRPEHWGDEFLGIDHVAEFVERLMQEKVAAYWADDGPNEGGSFGQISAGEVRGRDFRRGKVRTEIRSWRGSLDLSL
jgi:hypothetical protein